MAKPCKIVLDPFFVTMTAAGRATWNTKGTIAVSTTATVKRTHKVRSWIGSEMERVMMDQWGPTSCALNMSSMVEIACFASCLAVMTSRLWKIRLVGAILDV
jgi:hypothetical protein